ncbi:40S ribosomal protein S6 [Tupaia chinensis]|uniref:Small ribosomal subunit protein eS6 n=1 Tax=Tupaia chinensis TaxID=246437 RepID=L9KRS2_TUPCH|nr:40S ribosomal protein S6 [Tupaia chinensis]
MKLNISFPATGCEKLIEVDNERKLSTFYEKCMATEVAADALGGRMEGLCSLNQQWKQQTRFLHEAGHLDPQPCPPATEEETFLLQTKENWRKKAQICSGLHCGC